MVSVNSKLMSRSGQFEPIWWSMVIVVIGMIPSFPYLQKVADKSASYYVNEDQFTNEKNIARRYAGQKVWPRAVYVRRARFVAVVHPCIDCWTWSSWYNSARLHWNSIEKKRGPIEDKLIDDLVEWSIWHYPAVRQYVPEVCDPVTYFKKFPSGQVNRTSMNFAVYVFSLPYQIFLILSRFMTEYDDEHSLFYLMLCCQEPMTIEWKVPCGH